ncbi:hypothetical protein [Arthrobacter sp. EpRS71]|uniref:hypothetical protein n=1 Tax=Arthrobacter sp. EpRS71 TaxID=1743141 RepID=UPI000747BE03|nr:hypothetical protein [Arthrobacter sp. EpRS71]KUM39025.1 hypothetical protein AR689_07675 [Arthrobacter sp. EpRS71]
MADKKISDLGALTTADATDVVPLVDVSAGVTKKTTVAGLAAAVAANIPDGALPYAKGDGKIWWEELGRRTLSTSASSLSITGLASKKYLKVLFVAIPTTTIASMALQFNGDATSNYNYRLSTNGSADTNGAFAGIPVDPGSTPGTGSVVFGELTGIDFVGQEKAFIGHVLDTFATGANDPRRRELQGKWRNTARITSVQLALSAACAAGSELIVLGHD